MRLVVKTYKYKLYNSKKNRYLVRQSVLLKSASIPAMTLLTMSSYPLSF